MTGAHGSPASTRTAGAATNDSAGTPLEERLAERTRELDELTRQHAATVEIIDIVARSTSGLQPVLDKQTCEHLELQAANGVTPFPAQIGAIVAPSPG